MKVSVIIPCYNVEAYISECLQSIDKQTHTNLEIICIDDGSTDRTPELIKAWKATTNRETILITQQNLGACAARNAGIERATGTYIQFMDADDLLDKDKIEHQVKLASDNHLPDLIVGGYKKCDIGGNLIKRKRYLPEKRNFWTLLLSADLGCTISNLFRKEPFDRGLRWDNSLGSSQETALMFELLKLGTHPVFDPEVKCIIRSRESGSISQTDLPGKWARYTELRMTIIDYLKQHSADLPEHYNTLFDALRMLYPYNPQKAVKYYRETMPPGFQPQKTTATGKAYLTIHRLLGFGATEYIRSVFRKVNAR